MNVIVVGAGASGLTAAIVAKRNGFDVTIIEKNNMLGKKLLLTGNGRCNYFNEKMSKEFFYSNSDLSFIINDENIKKAKSFLDSIGLIPKIKDGYYYPFSNTSYAVLNALLTEIKNLDINIINEEVIDIKNSNKLAVYTLNNKYSADKVILATGGLTYQKTGSNGFGYELLKRLGHTLVSPKEALVPLVTDDLVKDWKGIRTSAKVSLFINNEFIISDEGEFQLTENGISGICVMNLSRFIDLNKTNFVEINFLPTIDDVYELLNNRNNLLKNRTIIELLESLINYKLLYFLFKKNNFDVNLKWEELNETDKNKLLNILTNYRLKIIGTKGKDYGEVTCGGLSLKDIKNNCESKIIECLYITGELLDIDGICGGYNLTNAWITGILAGEKND